MPEICLSGSEGGAKHALSLPYLSPGFQPRDLKIKEFALKLKGREADRINLAPIAAPQLLD